VPLHTLRADIDYGLHEAKTTIRSHRREGVDLQGRHPALQDVGRGQDRREAAHGRRRDLGPAAPAQGRVVSSGVAGDRPMPPAHRTGTRTTPLLEEARSRASSDFSHDEEAIDAAAPRQRRPRETPALPRRGLGVTEPC